MWKISLALIVVVGFSTFYFTSNAYKQSNEAPQKRTFFDAQHHLHVMGIVLGESTVRDAELAFKSRTDAALFLYPKANKPGQERQYTAKLEAYFPSIADHSKVMLTLEASDKEIEAIRQRSTPPRIYPNGVIRMNLSNQDIVAIQHRVIRQLSLVPSVQLDKSMLIAQFGQPKSVIKNKPGMTIYTFPDIGLTATIYDDAKDKLTFTNP